MAELKIGAPLACAEADDEWNDFTESGVTTTSAECTVIQKPSDIAEEMSNSQHSASTISGGEEDLSFMDSFLDKGKSGSLEDLVQTFDKKLSECFGDSPDNVSNIAPVQVRSQEDVINGCQ